MARPPAMEFIYEITGQEVEGFVPGIIRRTNTEEIVCRGLLHVSMCPPESLEPGKMGIGLYGAFYLITQGVDPVEEEPKLKALLDLLPEV